MVNSAFALAEGVDVTLDIFTAPRWRGRFSAQLTASAPTTREQGHRPESAQAATAEAAASGSVLSEAAPQSDLDRLYAAIQGSQAQAITALDAALALHCTANQAQAQLQHLAAQGILRRSALRGGEWDLPRYELPVEAGLCPGQASDPRVIRQRVGMSQRDFASALGIHVNTLLRWERHPGAVSSSGRALLRLINAMPRSALGVLQSSESRPRLLEAREDCSARVDEGSD